ncbi:MAG: methyltransferase domain-containing protein [Actinomycetota bacterium]|nr:methyltransferase domain-containing protein [Actinomycetota bacterium]
MSDERTPGGVSRRDLLGLGLSRVRERFDAELPEALATQMRRPERRAEPPWVAWDVAPPEDSQRFTAVAAGRLVEAGGVSEGERVLDLACGQGEVAVAAARRGAQVTAVDFARSPLDRGRELAAAEGLDIDWLEQDALDLQLGDGWFDRSLSGFGVIWATDPPRGIQELFRVTRPGGTVGFTTWTNIGFFGGLLRLARDEGLLPGGRSPSAWGRDERVRQDIEPMASDLELNPRQLELDLGDAQALWDLVGHSAAPMARLLARRSDQDRERVESDVIRLAGDGSEDGRTVSARYLEVVAAVPAV